MKSNTFEKISMKNCSQANNKSLVKIKKIAALSNNNNWIINNNYKIKVNDYQRFEWKIIVCEVTVNNCYLLNRKGGKEGG